jgi:hypothetical protein
MKEKFTNCIQNIQRNMNDFIDGKVYAIDDLATKIRVMCHHTKFSHSLLDQLKLEDKILFQNKKSKSGIQLEGLTYKILEGLDFYSNQTKIELRGGFKIKKDGYIKIDDFGNIAMNGLFWNKDEEILDNTAVNVLDYVAKQNIKKIYNYKWYLSDDIIAQDVEKKSSFNDWWSKDCVVEITNESYTRKDIVLYIANKAGGAHVDPHYQKEDLYTLEKEKIDQLLNMRFITSGLHSTLIIVAKELLIALQPHI